MYNAGQILAKKIDAALGGTKKIWKKIGKKGDTGEVVWGWVEVKKKRKYSNMRGLGGGFKEFKREGEQIERYRAVREAEDIIEEIIKRDGWELMIREVTEKLDGMIAALEGRANDRQALRHLRNAREDIAEATIWMNRACAERKENI